MVVFYFLLSVLFIKGLNEILNQFYVDSNLTVLYERLYSHNRSATYKYTWTNFELR